MAKLCSRLPATPGHVSGLLPDTGRLPRVRGSHGGEMLLAPACDDSAEGEDGTMICQPCQDGTHDDCLTAKNGPEQLGLGLSRSCDCWEYREVHVVLAKPAPRLKSEYDGWTDGEIRDQAHDTGEDEFETWIADSARELEEIGGM